MHEDQNIAMHEGSVLDHSMLWVWLLPYRSGDKSPPDKESFENSKTVCMQDMHRDPGYWSTSRMLLECAICMIPKHEKLLKADPYASTCPSGALPAAIVRSMACDLMHSFSSLIAMPLIITPYKSPNK